MKRSSCGARGRDAPPKAGPAQALARAQAPPRPSGGLLSWLEKLKIKTLLLIVFIVYASVPIFIYLFPSLLQKFVYLNFLVYPLWVDFNKPEVFLSHTANFHLTTEPGITLGIWAASYRVALTKVMSNGGFHVLAVDYRGYADSTGYPSEDGFTTDILFLYDWVKARSGNSSVILWGHSLGTGIATNTAKELKEKGIVVDTIILEAPFTNIRDAAAHIHIAKIYRKFPGFEYLVLDTMARADMHFPSDKNVKVLSSPLLILHSEDDGVIPVHLGKKLFEVARNASTKKENVKFIAFPANQRLGHEYIYSCPNLLTIVKDFLSSVKQ
ncbi:protein ABHD12B isoform X2 [Tiliqua scincoides]|uniref:protein ABHD12B isoform X2 n=1 Tax=Tiliqua scincoides TaxID=71010 RepID=UPI0034635969